MGLQKKLFLIFSVILLITVTAIHIILKKSHNKLIDKEISRLGEIITNQIIADRKMYSHIVEKMQ